jgi:hypothetical protein
MLIQIEGRDPVLLTTLTNFVQTIYVLTIREISSTNKSYWNNAWQIHKLHQCNFSYMYDPEMTCTKADIRASINENIEGRGHTYGACIAWPLCHSDQVATDRHNRPAPPTSPPPPHSLAPCSSVVTILRTTSMHRCTMRVVSYYTMLPLPVPFVCEICTSRDMLGWDYLCEN